VKLSKRYGSFPALDSLDLRITGSKCVGFLGPNGAGKTTTLKMFTDLIRPSSGEALINGVNVHTQKKKALADVGALIETPEIYPSLTPREALRMIAEIKGVPRDERGKRIEEVVSEVRMDEWLDKKVGKFSKGMKQRIAVASTLIGSPSVLLLDEPTTGLDPRGMSEVRDIVKSLKNKNRLIFMSSHLLNEVTDVCDEIAMIDHGKLIVYDSLQNVTNRFSGSETEVEVSFLHELDYTTIKKISVVNGVVSVERTNGKNLKIKFQGGMQGQARLFSEIAALNIEAVSLRGSATALEDAYLALIQRTL
jgi:ABC-2 type transport system ATP-binding protein